MKKTLGLAIALGVGGCGADSTPPQKQTAAEVDAAIQKSMDRLSALQVFPADGLVLNLPAEATQCYGQPCGDLQKWQGVIDAEHARQQPRLAKLADLTEAAAKDTTLAPRPTYDSELAVQALAALQIVHVYSLVQVQPANNAECYNLPCQSDIDEADRVNGLHIAQALSVAEAAKKSGL
jgi:hypothetical protein